MSTAPPPPRRPWADRLLDLIEWAGNKLPDSGLLFVLALLLTWLASAVLAPFDFGILDPRTQKPIVVHNQLTGKALVHFLAHMVQNFMAFPPLGVVLVAWLTAAVWPAIPAGLVFSRGELNNVSALANADEAA